MYQMSNGCSFLGICPDIRINHQESSHLVSSFVIVLFHNAYLPKLKTGRDGTVVKVQVTSSNPTSTRLALLCPRERL